MDLRRIDSDSIVDMLFHLKWKSEVAWHTDVYQASRINIWRDVFPSALLEKLKNKQAGDRIDLELKAGDILPPFDEKNLIQVRTAQFERGLAKDALTRPGIGRFFPQGLLKDVTGVFSANIQPCRCVELDNGQMTLDLNHPLSGKDLVLNALVGRVEAKENERGGTSVDWMEVLTTGPGMQARWQQRQSDYFYPGAFTRDDEKPDALFYGKPRFVQHIDDTAIEMVKNTYGRFIRGNMQVLDLMSSWVSHLPDNLNLGHVVGLGLNERELRKNPQLTDFLVQDLNLNPKLPFEANSFDVVVSTVSVEYLIDPLAVFEEVSRILRISPHQSYWTRTEFLGLD